MVIKYLYLDDENIGTVKPYSKAVMGDGKDVVIDVVHPAAFQGNSSLLFEKLKDYQGIILDWRLDETTDSEKKKFDSRASSVAQEIRTRATQKKFHSMPIVLWSQKSKFLATYQDDFTAHDLFDLTYKKEFVSENFKLVREQLQSMALGYQTIFEYKNERTFTFNDLLGLGESVLDIRIQERFKSKNHTVHEIARFIFRDLISRPGLLIDESRLAARLGIDKGNSAGWAKLLELLRQYKYTGPFGEAWPRWWAYGVEKEWWTSLNINDKKPLGLLLAEERVSLLKKATKIKGLNTALPIKENYHTRFYTICEYHKEPLDIVDGVIIAEPDPEAWQERRYISLDTALERLGDFKPHPTEVERLRQIKRKGK